MSEKLFIKNMVCARCLLVVRQLFEKAGLETADLRMGEVELRKKPTDKELDAVKASLKELGFEILDDRKQRQIENIKTLLIEIVQSGDIGEHFVVSEFLSQQLHKEYSQLSRLFSEVEGITIEQFFILQKIEKVKEWVVYDELTLSEISWKLGYSSVAHLSAQFKKVTGLSPSSFKKLGGTHRKSIDNIQP